MSQEYLNAEEITRYVKLSTVSSESLRAILDRSGLIPPTDEAVREYAEAGAALELLVIERDVHPTTGQTRLWLEAELTVVQEKINSAKTQRTKVKWQERRTEITRLLSEVPSAALEYKAARESWDADSVLDELRQMVERGGKARAEMAEQLTGNAQSALTALEWQDSKVETIALERLAQQALTLIDEHGWNVVEAAKSVLETVERRLLDNQLSGTSTGHGFRAVANCDRNAHRIFRDRMLWYVR